MCLGHHVRDLVHGTGDEVHKLKLSYRPHAGKRRAKSRTNNRRLRDGCINHALRTEAVNKAVGYFECAAVNTDVLTQTEDGRIALHLLPDSLPNRFEICKLCHELNLLKTLSSRAESRDLVLHFK